MIDLDRETSPPGTDYDLLAIGETMATVTVMPLGAERLGRGSALALWSGGAESNVAALAEMLGHGSAWAAAVGVDPVKRLQQHWLVMPDTPATTLRPTHSSVRCSTKA